MKKSKLWIGGEHLEPGGGEYFEDLNPSDQTVIAHVAKGTPADIDKAVRVAKETFSVFGQSQAKDREAILSRAAAIVERDREEYLQLLINEVGSPIMKAQFEVEYCINAYKRSGLISVPPRFLVMIS